MMDQAFFVSPDEHTLLQPGIPTTEAYKKLQNTNLYSSMKSYSSEFAQRFQAVDAFKHWSRRWEYSYAFDQISQASQGSSNQIRILDAGSALRYFPFYVSESHKNTNVTCCDLHPGYEKDFKKVNMQKNKEVSFVTTGLSDQPFEDDSFDIIYCISVLEHTENHEIIIQEFKRLLKPNGLLILTFDIALAHGRVEGLHPGEANELLKTLEKYLTPNQKIRFSHELKKPILSTKDFDKSELPWHSVSNALIPTLKHIFNFKANPWRQTVNFLVIPAFKDLLKFRKTPPLPTFMHLTIYCQTYHCPE